QGQGLPEGVAPGRSHASGDETQGAVRQWPLHHPYRWACTRGESCDPELSVRAQHARGIPGPVPLAAPFGRLLGQPLRPASRNLGLLPTDALRPPRDDQGRPAILSRRRAILVAVAPARSCAVTGL